MSKSKRQFPKGVIFAEAFPEEASEWVKCVSKPGLTINDVMCGSEERVLWRCRSCSHEWETVVYKRSYGHGCSKCAYNEKRKPRLLGTSAAIVRPDLVIQFQGIKEHPDLSLTDVSPSSRYVARWRCEKCKHICNKPIRNKIRSASYSCCVRKERAEDKAKKSAEKTREKELKKDIVKKLSVAPTAPKGLNDYKEDIIKEYLQGKSMPQIAPQYNVTPEAIGQLLKRNNILARSSREARIQYEFDETAFNELTPDVAYWIGFIMADGGVYNDVLKIAIHTKDIGHLEKFREFIKSPDRPIHTYPVKVGGFNKKVSSVSQIAIKSPEFCRALAQYGIVPNKSKTAQASKEIESNPDFWRGVIDGDGSIVITPNQWMPPRIRIVGSKNLMTQARKFIHEMVTTELDVNFCSNSLWAVEVKNTPARELLKIIYENETPSLDRKREKALTGLQYVNRKERSALKRP